MKIFEQIAKVLIGSDDLGTVPGWDAVRADQAWADTERLLLGWAGPAKVYGSRMAEERERRLRERRLRVIRKNA